MSKVKGTQLMEYARLIRANKDRDWKKYFSEEEMKILFGTVLPNLWYPVEIFEHAGEAIFKEIAQGKPEMARLWGRFLFEDTSNRFYRNLLRQQDPVAALEKIKTFNMHWYRFDDHNFQPVEVVLEAPGRVKMTIRYDHYAAVFEPYAHQLCGEFEKMVEANGGKEVKVEIAEHDYKASRPFAVIMVSWK